MTDLDAVLKKSLENASPHTRKVYGQNPLSSQEIIDMANGRGLLVIASTIGSNSGPHLAPADVTGVDGTLFLGVDEGTAHYRNLKRNPAVAVMITEGWKRQVILEGTVKFLEMNSELARRVQDLQKKKTGWTTEAIAEVKADKAFSWKGK